MGTETAFMDHYVSLVCHAGLADTGVLNLASQPAYQIMIRHKYWGQEL